jgi:hypothetical protein
VTDSVAAAVEPGRVRFAPVGEVVLKGLAEPVTLSRALPLID